MPEPLEVDFPEQEPTDSSCPECRQGKHGNCDGRSWDDDWDCPTLCPCSVAGHPVAATLPP